MSEPLIDPTLNEYLLSDKGLTLRDWLAGQAVGLGGEFFHLIDDHSDPPNEVEHVARCAYALADAMLKARER